MATKIVTKNSSTASAVPTTSDLVQGELAVNVADKKLFTEDNSGAIIELADGVKLAGIEASADVTDTANVTAAGALMDSELTSIASVKALNQGVATTDSPAFAGLTVDTTTLAVDSTNNRVGIGTASPSKTLVINENDSECVAIIKSSDTGTAGLFLGGQTDEIKGGIVFNNSDNSLQLRGQNNAERMRIDSSGNIGLRATSNVVSSTSGSGAWVSNGNYVAIAREGTSSAHPALYLNQTGVTGQVLQFRKDGTSVGSISTNGSSLPSDRNFKRNIESLDLGLDFVASLNPVTYNYKLDEEGQPVMTGLIAQEVEESLTAAGVEKNSMTLLQHTPTDDVKESDYQMDYLKLVPILINSIKEQQTLIESLTDRIAALEA